MSADRDLAGLPPSQLGAAARAAGLIAVAEDLAGEFSLRPLLERILRRCTELLGCHAGSICSVDEAAGTYRKEADIGVACQSGRVFPLTEGMTGAVVARRVPVWFARYDEVPGGHVAAEDRATLRGVIGVPLEWRGRIIGACVVFSRDEQRVFGPDDAEPAQRGINVRRNYVGNYCTSLDMAGVSITLSRLDDEISDLLAAPAEIAIRTF